MALSKTIEYKGVLVQNAYIKVARFSGNKSVLNFAVSVYARKDADDFVAESGYSCDYSLDGDNAIKQAYDYLKTLPEFADAVDC